MQLTGSIDSAHTGPISGRENVVIDLRNTSTRPCWLDGLPTVSGTYADGTMVRLDFQPLLSTYSRDVAGAGPVLADGIGRFSLSVGINQCAKPASHYTTLGIALPYGGTLDMPYPPELAVTPCPLNITQLGPVTTTD